MNCSNQAPFIAVNEPLLDGNEKKYLGECIDTGWISSEGPFVERFESAFASRVSRSYGIAVTNGTAAIDLAIEALGIKAGDEVILPAFTIISCVLQIVRSGAVPVLVDSDKNTWNMDVDLVESKITPSTKAIMAVHIYGLPVDMNPILRLCEKYNLKLIEDAAELIGQTYYGKPCGSFGDVSTVSFYPNKHITTGEGGMVLTNSEAIAAECRSLRNLCFMPEKRFVHDRLGWNFRMTNLQAAVGVAQLERLNFFIEKKRRVGRMYNELLANVANIQLPLESTDYADNIYWVYGVVLDQSFGLDADEMIKRMAVHGVGCRPFFYSLNKQPVLRKMGYFEDGAYPVSENISKKGFYIPSGLAITDSQIQQVVSALIKSMNVR
jgi:perosamine synthetase